MTDGEPSAWEELAQKIRTRRDMSIEEFMPAITEAPIQALLALAQGKVSATAVTKAFLKRAAIAQKLVNCVHELLPERALSRAKELDDFFARNGKTIGPLHGLPVSFKAHLGMKGCDASAGIVAWVENKFEDDAELLKILLSAGAVPYVRTMEPQALMMLETNSNITEVTVNPHNVALTPGGSSGGEGALQALFGSPLGVGTDIGGSIRSPAANCGIYGLKPTSLRIPLSGFAAWNLAINTINGTAGSMTPWFEGIDLFMETVLNAEPWRRDPSLHQIPWREPPESIDLENGGRLRVGVIWDDQIVKPLPPVARAIEEVVERLKLIPGVEVMEWKPYRHDEGINILKGLYSPDGGKFLESLLDASGEPALPLVAWAARDASGVQEYSTSELWDLLRRRDAFRYDYLKEWNTMAPDMDVILCPCHPNAAPLLETSYYWGYTSIWNLLDYPGVVFPVTRIDPERDILVPGEHSPRNEMNRWYREHYDPVAQEYAPVCLQLVAKKLEDEKVVQALRQIKRTIGIPFVN